MKGVMSVGEVVETHTSSTIDHFSCVLGLKCFVRRDLLIRRLGQSTTRACLFKTSTLPNGNMFHSSLSQAAFSDSFSRLVSLGVEECSQRRQEGIRNISCFSLYKLVRMNLLKSPGSPARMGDRLLLKSTRSYHHSHQKCDPR